MSPFKCAVIVDDALFMREVIFDALEGLFDKCYGAETFSEAKISILKFHPQLVTIDMSVDPVDPLQGMQLVKWIKDMGVVCSVVIISAIDQEHIRESAYASGVLDYVVKPFDKKSLYNRIVKVMENSDE